MTTATYLRTEALPLTDLTPFPGNAKIGDVPTILESLCRNGQYRSLIVRETEEGLTVLAGNHTLQAIAAHGPGDCVLTLANGNGYHFPCGLCGNQPWEPVARCEVVECDDATARRINLADNKTAERGGWDESALAELLDGLDDFTGTGYSESDLADLVTAVEEALLDVEEEELVPAAVPPVIEAAAAVRPPGATPESPAVVEELSAVGDVFAPSFIEPGAPAAPDDPQLLPVRLSYSPADRDEVTRLIIAARVGSLKDATAPDIVLRSLRALIAVLDSRHAPDQPVTVAALLRAAGVNTE